MRICRKKVKKQKEGLNDSLFLAEKVIDGMDFVSSKDSAHNGKEL